MQKHFDLTHETFRSVRLSDSRIQILDNNSKLSDRRKFGFVLSHAKRMSSDEQLAQCNYFLDEHYNKAF